MIIEHDELGDIMRHTMGFWYQKRCFRTLNFKNLMIQFCRDLFNYEKCIYGCLEIKFFLFLINLSPCKVTKLEIDFNIFDLINR